MQNQPTRSLPEHPDLRHLKDEAKALVKAGEAASLAEAQLRIAREYRIRELAQTESTHRIVASIAA